MLDVVGRHSASTALPVRDLTTEEELILRCIRTESSVVSRRRDGYLVANGGLDWDAFWMIAAQQRILPAVACSLSGLDVDLPKSQGDIAQAIRWRTLSSNLLRRAELDRIASALYAKEIPTVPLKGTHLIERIYGRLDQRQASDIDALVPESRLGDSQAVLCNLGYSPIGNATPGMSNHQFHTVPLVRVTSTFTYFVELHWNLSDPRYVTIDYPALWKRALAHSPDEAILRPLPGEELLVFLALHLYKHHTGLLRLLVDVDRLVRREGPTFDWSYVTWLARQWNVTSHLFFALIHARLLLDTPLDEQILDTVRPAAWRRSLVTMLAGPRTILRPPASQHLRYGRFRMAYCAMLHPFSTVVKAYIHYLFPWPEPRHTTALGEGFDFCRRMTVGIARTGNVVMSSLVDPYGGAHPPYIPDTPSDILAGDPSQA